MSNTTLGFDDVELQIGDGATPEVFTRACRVQSFDGPTRTRTTFDTSTLCSTAKTKGSGMLDNGSITLNLLRDETEDDFVALVDALESGDLLNLRIVNTAVTPNTYEQFSVRVSSLKSHGVAIDQAITASATLDISGAITSGTVS